MQSLRYVRLERYADAVVAQLVDSILRGAIQAEMLRLELQHVMNADGPKRFVVDFRHVKMISSNVVQSLLAIQKHATSLGVDLKFSDMSRELREVFRTLNLDGSVFAIVESTHAALHDQVRPRSYFDVCGRVSPPDEDYDVTTIE